MIINKIISGGQTGADAGGLAAALKLNIETGGWMPKGFKTLDGPNPELAKICGMQEHASSDYPPRTFQNVADSDGTIRFASNFNSAGELCTLKAINKFNKPYLDIDINNPLEYQEVRNWLETYNIKILNVAGNSEQTSPNITNFVYEYLLKVLDSTMKLEIKGFTGNYRFLSNFFPAEVHYDGVLYKTSEAAYQAAKTLNKEKRIEIQQAKTPGQAKKLGNKLKLRNDWELIKLKTMENIVLDKFIRNQDLKNKLLNTKDAYLEETNYWNDCFWGVCKNKGENNLGKILMKTRELLNAAKRNCR